MPAPHSLHMFAFGLTALLALSIGQEWPWAGERRAWAPPAWVLLLALVVVALASGVFGVLEPESFILAAAEP